MAVTVRCETEVHDLPSASCQGPKALRAKPDMMEARVAKDQTCVRVFVENVDSVVKIN
jgi:hypothetical protein